MANGYAKAAAKLGIGWKDADVEKKERARAELLCEMDQAGWLVVRGVGDVYSPTNRHGNLAIERVPGGFNVYGASAFHMTDEQAFAVLEWIAARFGMEILRDIVPSAENTRRLRELVAEAVSIA